MSQLSDIREAVADTIRGGGWSREFTVHAYAPGTYTGDCIVVEVAPTDPIDWFNSFGALRIGTVRLNVRILVALTDETGQRILDEVLSQGSAEGSSIVDLFTADQTLGGVVDSCQPLSVSQYGWASPNGENSEGFVGAVVPLEVKTRRVA